MDIIKEKRDGILIARLNGRLDTESSFNFETVVLDIIKSGEKSIGLDFSGVTAVTSSGIRAVLACIKQAKKESSQLVLFSVKPSVMSIFEATALTTIVEFAEDEEKAAALLKSHS